MKSNDTENFYFGYEAVNIQKEKNIYRLQLRRHIEEKSLKRIDLNSNIISSAPIPDTIHCTYLIAADGAHSNIRESHQIEMNGNPNIQSLLNIHFRCTGFSQQLERVRAPAMLYFVFNEVMIICCSSERYCVILGL